MSDALSPVNPFHEGAAGEYFVGREQQLKRFERALTSLRHSHPNHMYVAGVNGRGKTSFLAKLVEVARENDVLAVKVDLDGGVSARQQIISLFEKLVTEVDEALAGVVGVGRLDAEWKSKDGSPFRLPKEDRLQNDHLRQDLAYVSKIAGEQGFHHMVICIDEGERIEPYALSALKSALLSLKQYFVVLSLRLADDLQDPVRAGRLRLEEIAAAADRDIGAARLFVAGVGLESFTDIQARQCMLRRLENNSISFDDAVIDLIARVAERLPDRIIQYAYDVYERTADEAIDVATVEMFRHAFVERHRPEMAEAMALRVQCTGTERRTLRELAHHDAPITPLDLARKVYSNVPADALEPVANGIMGMLNRVCASAFCIEADEQYIVPDPVRRYALEISMEPE